MHVYESCACLTMAEIKRKASHPNVQRPGVHPMHWKQQPNQNSPAPHPYPPNTQMDHLDISGAPSKSAFWSGLFTKCLMRTQSGKPIFPKKPHIRFYHSLGINCGRQVLPAYLWGQRSNLAEQPQPSLHYILSYNRVLFLPYTFKSSQGLKFNPNGNCLILQIQEEPGQRWHILKILDPSLSPSSVLSSHWSCITVDLSPCELGPCGRLTEVESGAV